MDCERDVQRDDDWLREKEREGAASLPQHPQVRITLLLLQPSLYDDL